MNFELVGSIAEGEIIAAVESPYRKAAQRLRGGAIIIVMNRDFKELFQEAGKLPERDRAALAGLLIESLEPAPEPDVEAAWSQEIARRVAELDAGGVELISWEEVRAELLGRRNDR
ncbi:MAG: addiction module protein [Acidobacteria bacterium]|nr:addiction module protein [Acidobacteriota bacterium]